jgi:hypothetical protein
MKSTIELVRVRDDAHKYDVREFPASDFGAT